MLFVHTSSSEINPVISLDPERKLDLSFLISLKWWANALNTVLALWRQFFIAAFLLGWSNIFCVYAELFLKSNVDLIQLELSDVHELMRLGGILAFCTFLGLVLGLVSLSVWMTRLTALSRLVLVSKPVSEYSQVKDEVIEKRGYLTTFWMVGALFLVPTLVPASVFMSLNILSSSQISILGEPLLSLPAWSLLPITVSQSILLSVALAHSLILIIASSWLEMQPFKTATQSAAILFKQFFKIMLVTVLVVLINALISAPITIYISYFAPESMRQDLFFVTIGQLWFGISASLLWPLSLLIFLQLISNSFSRTEKLPE